MVDINYRLPHPCAMETSIRTSLGGHTVCQARKVSHQFKVKNRDGVACR
jgi:hypothetical protein